MQFLTSAFCLRTFGEAENTPLAETGIQKCVQRADRGVERAETTGELPACSGHQGEINQRLTAGTSRAERFRRANTTRKLRIAAKYAPHWRGSLMSAFWPQAKWTTAMTAAT